jgi:dihydrofolate reductase
MITSLIVAASRNEVIGAQGSLPWHLPDDQRRFRRLTTGHPVVVGRVTYESILARLGRPLPGRTSIVISSRSPGEAQAGVIWATSVEAAMSAARAIEASAIEAGAGEAGAGEAGAGEAGAGEAGAGEAGAAGGEVFVIGGTSVYAQALPQVDRIYLTRVHREVEGDTSMPPGWLDGFTLIARDDRPGQGSDSAAYSFLDYVREPSS